MDHFVCKWGGLPPAGVLSRLRACSLFLSPSLSLSLSSVLASVPVSVTVSVAALSVSVHPCNCHWFWPFTPLRVKDVNSHRDQASAWTLNLLSIYPKYALLGTI